MITRIIVFLSLLKIPVISIAGDNGTLAFVLDNEVFVGTDKNYTNGLRLSWMSESLESEKSHGLGESYTQTIKNALDFLPFVDGHGKRHNASLAIGQVMMTPEDITATELLPDQSPYMGYLYLTAALYVWNYDAYQAVDFTLGRMGAKSGAESAQKFIHDILGADEPRGWHNQIGDKNTVSLGYTHGLRLYQTVTDSGKLADFTFNWRVTLGNYETSAGTAGVFRWGKNLPHSFNMYYSGNAGESALLGLFENNQAYGWGLHAGLLLKSYTYSLVEKEAQNTHQYELSDVLAQFFLGVALYGPSFQLGFTLEANSSPVKNGEKHGGYGAISMIWNF